MDPDWSIVNQFKKQIETLLDKNTFGEEFSVYI